LGANCYSNPFVFRTVWAAGEDRNAISALPDYGAGVARVAEEPLPDIKPRQRRPVILRSIFSASAPKPSGHPGWMARVENAF
jgi:hypothetical protein